MARTKWGIVYRLADRQVMMHILPTLDDSELDHPSYRQSDSKFITIPIVDNEDHVTFNNRIAAAVNADAGVA